MNGRLPSQLKYYPSVVLGIRPKDWENSDYTSFDGAYWFGNGLGSTDLGIELKGTKGTWLLYHQHIYEDFSGLAWKNTPDGLTGLSWRLHSDRPPGGLTRVVVEFLNTMNQSGSTFDLNASYQGTDNYFNHGQYREGWSYLGRTIGTPFIMPYTDITATAHGSGFFPNNRLRMAYLGASGQVGNSLVWLLRFSGSRNYGTYSTPYSTPYNQLSALASVQWQMPRLRGTQLTASIAFDQGQLLPRTLGGFIGLQKNW